MRKRTRTSRPRPDDEEAARERCLRLLAVRPRSAAELLGRLRNAGFSEETAGRVVSGLAEAGLVDDKEFARAWVAERLAAGAGRQKLRWELRRKGIAADLISQEVDQRVTDEVEAEQALALARRRLGDRRPEGPELDRLRRLLLGRGFGFETVATVLRRLCPEQE